MLQAAELIFDHQHAFILLVLPMIFVLDLLNRRYMYDLLQLVTTTLPQSIGHTALAALYAVESSSDSLIVCVHNMCSYLAALRLPRRNSFADRRTALRDRKKRSLLLLVGKPKVVTLLASPMIHVLRPYAFDEAALGVATLATTISCCCHPRCGAVNLSDPETTSLAFVIVLPKAGRINT